MPVTGGYPGVVVGGTAGQLLRKTSDTDYAMEWASLAGVPGAGSADVADKALVPHPSDDEFSDASLTGWTQVNGGGTPTVTWAEAGDALSCSFTNNNAGAILGQLKPISIGIGGYIQTAVKLHMQVNSPSAYLILASGTAPASNCVVASFQLASATNSTTLGVGNGSLASAVISAPALSLITAYSPLHMRLIWLAANTWRVHFSPDGISWPSTANITDLASALTPTFMGLGVGVNSASGYQQVATFEYFRASA